MHKPTSATHGFVALSGLLAFALSLFVLRTFEPFNGDVISSCLFVIACITLSIFLVDLVWSKVYLRPSTGLSFKTRNPSWSRTRIKYLGLVGSLGFVCLMYWLFPEYREGNTYKNYFLMLERIWAPTLVLALVYFYWLDAYMVDPCDGYWHTGRFLLCDWSLVNWPLLGQHLLGWVVKGFFLPLMFIYMCHDLNEFLKVDFFSYTNFQQWYGFTYDLVFLLDLSLVAMGYMMCFRITDTQIRSVEPTMLGWVVAIMCYKPFWGFFEQHYLRYDADHPWGAWLWNYPLMYGIWGSCILVLLAIYAWSTACFGARFSNLTNRGIITGGPYALTKHPSYISKNLSWWMVSVPFIVSSSAGEAVRHSLLLLLLNIVYILRAKTEERHLSRDPDYVSYANWMEERGLFRWIRSTPILRLLSYKQPRT
jgi:protein-S-isoprenylcysteine O-methyltransferase Ste14